MFWTPSSTLEIQAQTLARAQKLHKPHSTEEKNKERHRINIKQTYKQKEWTNKTPQQMVKATPNIQEHMMKLTHTKKKKE